MRQTRVFLLFLILLISASVSAKDLEVKSFKYAGPFILQHPFIVDSVSMNKKQFYPQNLLSTPVNIDLADNGETVTSVQKRTDQTALNLLQFDITNTLYRKISIDVSGMKNYELYLDGKSTYGRDLALIPSKHSVVIKYITDKESKDSLKVILKHVDDNINVSTDATRTLVLKDLMDGKRYSNATLSANGRYMITVIYDTLDDGTAQWIYRVIDLKTGNILNESSENIAWIPFDNRYYKIKNTDKGRTLLATDPTTGREEILATGIGEGYIRIAPKAKYLIISTSETAKREDKGVYEIINPEDRQASYRTRYNLALFDPRTGVQQPLTYGYHSVSLKDISSDGKYILFTTSDNKFSTERPTLRSAMYRMNVETFQVDTIVKEDGFINDALFSPDGKNILIRGGADAFDGIGKKLPEGRIPNSFDYQLFLFNIATKSVKPLTKNFDPSVTSVKWNYYDNKVYFLAQDRDNVPLFSLDIKNGKITKIQTNETYLMRTSFASTAPIGVWLGQSASNSDRLYTYNTSNSKSILFEDLGKKRLADIVLGETHEWNFVSSRGDTIQGRIYLPPHFDKTKKYPLIVNYYGGCVPSSTFFDSHYSGHMYAAQGYVVYVLNPSGAAGFGQEFASRHVNTAGKGVAEDIIEGTKAFLKAHPFADEKHIGCIGASYGGFMTQYLQTQTDIFAAAVSHAGISDHTSYWGEGYWGYSYSQTSMANSFPWTRKDLYVDQSPLFNADKIHTPLLFLHGNADTNVPIGESIQMFTALKLLGRPTAFVVVDGENHFITNYVKRIKWQNSIFAWFAKWLKEDNKWWNDLHPETLQ